MKDEQGWQATKFRHVGGRLSVGPTTSPASWLVTQLVAQVYQKHLATHARGRLVDLGCGTVPLYAAYRPLVSEITCVDWGGSPHDARHIDVAHDLNQPLPLPENRYDTAILSDVLEHIRRPDVMLSEVRRILAPRGKLLLNVPFLYWLHEQPHDYFRYSEHALRSMIEQAGLRLLLLEGLGSAPEVLADIVGKHLAQIPGVGPALSSVLQRTAYSAARLEPVAKALVQSSQRFPIAYFLVAEKF